MAVPARRLAALAALTAFGALLGFAPSAAAAPEEPGKQLYRWTDDKGVVHYSDHVPAEATTQQREVLDSRGQPRGVLPKQKTPAEIAEQAKQEEAQRKQDANDRYLLGFPKLSDLEAARDERLAGIDRRIDESNNSAAEMRRSADALHERMEAAQANNQPVDPAMQKQFDNYQTLLAARSRALIQMMESRAATEHEFQADIERYKTLRADTAPDSN